MRKKKFTICNGGREKNPRMITVMGGREKIPVLGIAIGGKKFAYITVMSGRERKIHV